MWNWKEQYDPIGSELRFGPNVGRLAARKVKQFSDGVSLVATDFLIPPPPSCCIGCACGKCLLVAGRQTGVEDPSGDFLWGDGLCRM